MSSKHREVTISGKAKVECFFKWIKNEGENSWPSTYYLPRRKLFYADTNKCIPGDKAKTQIELRDGLISVLFEPPSSCRKTIHNVLLQMKTSRKKH